MKVTAVSSKVVGEMPTETEALEAEIGADMPDLDQIKVGSRAKIGRFHAPNIAGYLLSNSIVDRDSLEKVQRKLLKKLDDTNDVRALCALAEAMKNIVNTGVAVAGAQLKSLEILAYTKKKENRQANAPQAIITGDNPQIVVSGNPVGQQ